MRGWTQLGSGVALLLCAEGNVTMQSVEAQIVDATSRTRIACQAEGFDRSGCQSVLSELVSLMSASGETAESLKAVATAKWNLADYEAGAVASTLRADARAAAEQATVAMPSDAEAWVIRAEMAADAAAKIELLREGRAAAPEDQTIPPILSALLLDDGTLDEAAAIYEAYVPLTVASGREVWTEHADFTESLRLAGRIDLAGRVLSRLLDLTADASESERCAVLKTVSGAEYAEMRVLAFRIQEATVGCPVVR
jgi:hypothetical protein